MGRQEGGCGEMNEELALKSKTMIERTLALPFPLTYKLCTIAFCNLARISLRWRSLQALTFPLLLCLEILMHLMSAKIIIKSFAQVIHVQGQYINYIIGS
jgi:hypothetical protein